MKIVITANYGSYDLNKETIIAYAKRTGQPLYFDRDTPYNKPNVDGHTAVYPDDYFNTDIPRTDEDLIAVIEELGINITGLKIVDIPKGCAYRIQEYDGLEWVELADDVVWSIAT